MRGFPDVAGAHPMIQERGVVVRRRLRAKENASRDEEGWVVSL